MKEKLYHNFERVAGGDPTKNIINVVNSKTYQNIWIFFIMKCNIYSRIEIFFIQG